MITFLTYIIDLHFLLTFFYQDEWPSVTIRSGGFSASDSLRNLKPEENTTTPILPVNCKAEVTAALTLDLNSFVEPLAKLPKKCLDRELRIKAILKDFGLGLQEPNLIHPTGIHDP